MDNFDPIDKFESGWARVKIRSDEHYGRVAEIIAEEEDSAGNVWFTLQIDDEEIIYEARQLAACHPPKGTKNDR